jgi:hypothetical protein
MIRKITAITLGLFVSILIAIACGIVVGVASYLDFWRALFASLEGKEEPIGVWDRHIARLEEQNKKD